MVDEKEMQEKILAYRIIEARMDGLLKQREMLASKFIELEIALEGLDEIEKTDEQGLFSIGSETYFFGKVTDKKRLVVEIGANIAIEKTFEEGRKSLRERRDEIEKMIVGLENNVMQLSSRLQGLEVEIRGLVGEKAG